MGRVSWWPARNTKRLILAKGLQLGEGAATDSPTSPSNQHLRQLEESQIHVSIYRYCMQPSHIGSSPIGQDPRATKLGNQQLLRSSRVVTDRLGHFSARLVGEFPTNICKNPSAMDFVPNGHMCIMHVLERMVCSDQPTRQSQVQLTCVVRTFARLSPIYCVTAACYISSSLLAIVK